MSQQELAEALNALAARRFRKHPNITKKTVGRLERGEVDLLTVAVVEPRLYDELFSESVKRNDEGVIPARALPFEEHRISRLRELGQLSPDATAAIHLTWKHREALLGPGRP
jgi:hypothetical protein